VDCYRLIGDDKLAEMDAREIIRKTNAADGTALSPMPQGRSRDHNWSRRRPKRRY
jgi:hypothetical protein